MFSTLCMQFLNCSWRELFRTNPYNNKITLSASEGSQFDSCSHKGNSIIHWEIKMVAVLNIREYNYLRQLPCAITNLFELSHVELLGTPVIFIPNRIHKLTKLNYLNCFMVPNNNTGSKLEDLNLLK
ncbi:hypothetical protein KFK09_006843 [Dendrobium nobile]|uniref:Disease resistance protein n=1 Tax=Dendrobium nobile TaxID=94219 RepID=A0A8T3BUL9_DENNO|nr:hypothetical protein KFK09_006843 [Dendrobium nobile]